MDMTKFGDTSGVDRYLDVLTKGLQHIPYIQLHRIQLIEGGKLLFVRRKQLPEGGILVQIPLPLCLSEFLTKSFWIKKYNEQVYRLTYDLFDKKERIILHLHTLNLIDLACYIKEQIPTCRIITHLHCIPWKALYNNNTLLFNYLYEMYYVRQQTSYDKKAFLCFESEWKAYHNADRVVCVTDCARNFLAHIMERKSGVYVIPNGMEDKTTITTTHKYTRKSDELQCLYVGAISKSKGIQYILDAMRKVSMQGYNVKLIACGNYCIQYKKQLLTEYSDVSVEFTGLVSYDTLCSYYTNSDIGIIASLQEQSSYVAIEMMRFGMPIITTAVDGLNEMFDDKVNCLKIKTSFSTAFGLSVNTDAMAECIIHLIKNPRKREYLGKNAYKNYLEKFTVERMIHDTISVYENILI